MTAKTEDLRIFWAVGLLGFALDQLTKRIVELHPQLPLPSHPDWNGGIEVIPGFFYLVHVGNPGAAWGMFSGFGFVLGILAILALLAIWCFRRSIGLYQRTNQLAIGLVASGILGNLADRIFRGEGGLLERLFSGQLFSGEVVDFLLFRFGNWDYPVFNVADSAICLGVAIYIIANWNADSASPPGETEIH